MPRSAPARCALPSASTATASGRAIAWRHSAGTPGGILKPGTGSSGVGAIYHTVNPRLFPDQIAWIVNHAEDRVMMTDLTFVPLLEKLADKLADGRAVRRADRCRAHARDDAAQRGSLRRVDRRSRRRFRLENVRREHRRRHVLHLRHHRQSQGRALFAPLQRAAGASRSACRTCSRISSRDVVLPIVPMFHANGWSLAFSAPMVGASLVMPGRSSTVRRSTSCSTEYRVTLQRRGADRVAHAAAAPRSDRQQAAAPQPGGDRRRGLPARSDRGLRAELRRRGVPCLGHDRDEPARHAVLDEAGIRGAHRQGAARHPGQAGSRRPSASR